MAPKITPTSPATPVTPLPIPARGRFGAVTGPLAETHEFSVGVDGPKAKAQWIVEEVAGSDDFILPIAMGASGIPRIGDLYPGMTDLPVRQVSAAMVAGSNRTVVVTVEWGQLSESGGGDVDDPNDPEQPATIEISSTVQSGTTMYDGEGKALWLSQNFDWDDDGNQIINKRFSEWKEVEIQRPMHVVKFAKLRNQSPGDIAVRYVGHVNSTVIFGDQPGMWLCTRLDGSSDDGGLTYMTHYEFQRAPELIPLDPQGFAVLDPLAGGGEQLLGWDVVISLESQFQDDNVLTPANYKQDAVNNEVGIKVARIYPRADFRQLNGLAVHFGPE